MCPTDMTLIWYKQVQTGIYLFYFVCLVHTGTYLYIQICTKYPVLVHLVTIPDEPSFTFWQADGRLGQGQDTLTTLP